MQMPDSSDSTKKDQRQLSSVTYVPHGKIFLFVYWVAIFNLLTEVRSIIANETVPYPFKSLLSEFLFL